MDTTIGNVKVAKLEQEITAQLYQENPPVEIAEVASHTAVESVSDVSIDTVTPKPDVTSIVGTAEICFELQYGSCTDVENDMGFTRYLSGTVKYQADFDHQLDIVEFSCELVESAELDADFMP